MSYTALVLNSESRQRLLSSVEVPDGWEILAHHMTINIGSPEKGPAADLIGQEAPVTIVSQAQDEQVMAVGVESPIPSINKVKHITIAVNRAAGGTPQLSNKLTDWQPRSTITLKGVVTGSPNSG